MLSTRTLLLAALAVGLAGSARAQEISSVSPSEGTIGTVLTIEGSGFGTKKPKVLLVDPETGKSKGFKAKVTEASDGQLTVELKKAKFAGTFDVHVKLKGKGAPELTAERAFEVKAPQILQVLDLDGMTPLEEAMPGQQFMVRGTNFGKKKGKVKIGGKKAKVVSWTPGDGTEEGAAPDSAIFAMPKKLANGQWTIELTTKVGVDESAQIQMVGSTVKIGKTKLDVKVRGEPVKFKATPSASIPAAGTFILFGTTKSNPSATLSIVVPFNTETDMAPVTLNAGPTSLLNATYIETGKIKGPVIPPIDSWGAGLGLGSLQVQINASSGGQVAGTFTGLLPLQSSTQGGADSSVTIEGSFVLEP